MQCNPVAARVYSSRVDVDRVGSEALSPEALLLGGGEDSDRELPSLYALRAVFEAWTRTEERSLLRGIAYLSEKKRGILVASLLSRTTCADLARDLHCTRQAVQRHLVRALVTMRLAAELESWPASPTRVARDLGGLLTPEQCVLTWTYWGERFSVRRTAVTLDVPVTLVRTKLHDARPGERGRRRPIAAILADLKGHPSAGPYARDFERVSEWPRHGRRRH